MKLSKPDYDSGWLSGINPGGSMQWNHGLATRKIFVYLLGRCPYTNGFEGIHQLYYGTAYVQDPPHSGVWKEYGMRWWSKSQHEIAVQRGYDDIYWVEFRVLIWVIPS